MPIDTLRVVLGDQLSEGIAALSGLDAARDVVLLMEVMDECIYVPHHRKKIVLVLSAMRHFAQDLARRGVNVRYIRLDDPANTHSLAGEVGRAITDLKPSHVLATEAGEWRVQQSMRDWAPGIEILPDRRFLCSIGDFRHWARGRSTLRLEFFYREMRQRTGLLMTKDGKPEGGQWNFDPENRKRLPARLQVPPRFEIEPDETTRDVLDLVRSRFPDGFGDLEEFRFPVTARDAERALADFITHRLPGFGNWQDAMRRDDATLFHAIISPALNLGLLDPLSVCEAVEAAWRAGSVPLNSAEGFIRQVIGWREFVRGVYWLHMPKYAKLNALKAERALPSFYWSGETSMECLRQVVTQTRHEAYAHHIQRLMVTGNFALLAGLHPDAVDEWYLSVYADAFEWVEMPNTRGMALYADGGVVGSKPYAASGAYINRMSDYCGACRYDVSQSIGPDACPFNALYWDFIARHAALFGRNPRMAMPVRSWNKMDPARQAALRAQAEAFLDGLK